MGDGKRSLTYCFFVLGMGGGCGRVSGCVSAGGRAVGLRRAGTHRQGRQAEREEQKNGQYQPKQPKHIGQRRSTQPLSRSIVGFDRGCTTSVLLLLPGAFRLGPTGMWRPRFERNSK